MKFVLFQKERKSSHKSSVVTLKAKTHLLVNKDVKSKKRALKEACFTFVWWWQVTGTRRYAEASRGEILAKGPLGFVYATFNTKEEKIRNKSNIT